MEITTKELRIQPGKIIDQVAHGQEVTVTYRGKAMARIIPLSSPHEQRETDEDTIFGMWKDHTAEKSVEELVRDIRKGRQF